MIIFKLNGENSSIETNITINEYLNSLNLDINSVVVLLNNKVLEKSEYNCKIYENCEIEILRFVSGG